MRSLSLSSLSIVILSVLAALGTWRVVGPPGCDPDELPPHHVCLATVRDWPIEKLVWVDARSRDAWEKDGVVGSVLLNDREDWDDLEIEFMMKVFDGSGLKVVVYCDQAGCGSSSYVADRLRERHAGTLDFEVYVLQGGRKALRR